VPILKNGPYDIVRESGKEGKPLAETKHVAEPESKRKFVCWIVFNYGNYIN